MSTAKHSLQYLLEQYKGEHDLTTDVLKCILMNDTFTFDPEAHSVLTDVSASELAAGNGYTQGGKTVESVTATIDTANEKVTVQSAAAVSWEASGGDMAASAAAIIFNDTHANKTIVVGVQFDTAKTAVDGTFLNVNTQNGIAEALITLPA